MNFSIVLAISFGPFLASSNGVSSAFETALISTPATKIESTELLLINCNYNCKFEIIENSKPLYRINEKNE